jgi:hypothetical protein
MNAYSIHLYFWFRSTCPEIIPFFHEATHYLPVVKSSRHLSAMKSSHHKPRSDLSNTWRAVVLPYLSQHLTCLLRTTKSCVNAKQHFVEAGVSIRVRAVDTADRVILTTRLVALLVFILVRQLGALAVRGRERSYFEEGVGAALHARLQISKHERL